MDRREYTAQVLSCLRRVTWDEREAIRAELDGHMEDHFESLRELGYDEREAEERTLAAMGDPAEVGRELNQQYTGWGFVLLSRAAVLLTVVLCVQTLLGLGILGNFYDSVRARTLPEELTSNYSADAVSRPDMRIPIGNDVLRIYRVSVGTKNGVRAAEVAMAAYDRIPGGVVSGRLTADVELEDQRGVTPEHTGLGGSGKGNYGAEYSLKYLPVQEGDTCITLRYDRFGEHIAVKIPLPEGGGA